MTVRQMSQRILTANRLNDGLVVYLSEGGRWSASLSDADIAEDDAREALLTSAGTRAVAQRVVVDPYLIDITIEHGTRRPVRFREAIRAGGPTVETRAPADPGR